MSAPLRIGVSACFFHADPQRPIFKGKTLLYLEQSMANWILEHGALAYLIPPGAKGGLKCKDLVHDLDGLILQGGSDVSPKSYGETPLRPEWQGDYVRDQYEIELLTEFMAQEKPVLGVCRGAQLMNVAFGGSLYQDLATQLPNSVEHRNWHIYDQNFHTLRWFDNSHLAALYPSSNTARVNSVHHQAVKRLGRDLAAEAECVEDGVIEAIRHTGKSYALAVQWHPEFHTDNTLLDSSLLIQDFLRACKLQKG